MEDSRKEVRVTKAQGRACAVYGTLGTLGERADVTGSRGSGDQVGNDENGLD